ncbi:MAG: replication-relaxation family protein [Terriglobia bacterium]|nr:replication-relaxation family protein [Terriglobia bacterium]
MRQLRKAHFDLFRLLNEHFLFLTRKQVALILTLSANPTIKWLLWLVSEHYLERRYRASSFSDFQTPLYYLGPKAWRMLGNPPESYKPYRAGIEQWSGVQLEHQLAVYDVILKFLLEAGVRRIVQSQDRFWHESLSFEVIPDAWIEYAGGQAFLEIDRATESRQVVMQKLEKYIRFNESGLHKILLPGTTFRVLFITTSEEWIEALEQLTRSDDVWFATMEEFLKEPLDHQHWFALKGFYALQIAPKEEVQELR